MFKGCSTYFSKSDHYNTFVTFYKQCFGSEVSKQCFNRIYIKNYRCNSDTHKQCFLVFDTSVLIVDYCLTPYEYEDADFG